MEIVFTMESIKKWCKNWLFIDQKLQGFADGGENVFLQIKYENLEIATIAFSYTLFLKENSKFVRANPVYVVEVWPLILSRTNIAIATLKVHSNYLNCCNQSLKILMDNWVKRFSFLCFFPCCVFYKTFLAIYCNYFQQKN